MKSNRARRRACALAFACASTLTSLSSTNAEVFTLAITGQGAPTPTGPDGAFDTFLPRSHVLNNAGQVAFTAQLVNTAAGDADNAGVFLFSPAGLAQVARKGQPSPDANGTLAGFFEASVAPLISETGHVLFLSQLSGTNGGLNDDVALFRGNGGPLLSFAREGQAVASAFNTPSGFISSLPPTATRAATANGRVAFAALLPTSFGGGISAGTQSGIFLASPTGLLPIARRNQTIAPGEILEPLNNSPLAVNALGQVAFIAASSVSIGGGQGIPQPGIFVGAGGQVTRVARVTQAAPDGVGTYASFPGEPSINRTGQVLFSATLNASAGGAFDAAGLFLGSVSGATATQVVRRGQFAPDGNGYFTGNGNGLFVASLNDSGQVSFITSLAATADGFGDSGAIFRWTAGTLAQVVRTGQTTPDGGKIVSLGQHRLLAGGQVFSYAGIRRQDEPVTDDAFLLADPKQSLLVARVGQTLAGSTIFALNAVSREDPGGQSSANDLGQVAYHADLADGRSGVFLYTPELHYRSASAGMWDNPDNWTVGLRPAHVHHVLIDPPVGATVTGPAAATTVRSLRVGPSGTGVATVSLSAGGNLAAPEGITVDFSGRIELANGTLSSNVGLTNFGTVLHSGGTLSSFITSNQAEYRLASPSAVVQGAVFYNAGLLTGAGRVEATFYNEPPGELRSASPSDRILFTAFGFNFGRMNLSSGGTFEFPAGLSNPGTLTSTAGSNTFHGPLFNENLGKVIVTGGSTLTFYQPLTLNPGSEFRVSANSRAVFFGNVAAAPNAFTGPGEKYFEAGQSDLGPLASPGSTTVEAAASIYLTHIRESALTVRGRARVSPSGTPASTSQLGSLAIELAGQFDLADNNLILEQGNLATITALVASARNTNPASLWTSPGLTSSAAAENPLTTLALIPNSRSDGSPLFTTFDGLSTHPGDLLIAHATTGDTDLDDLITADDYARIDRGFLERRTNYHNGDLDYSGTIDLDDYTLIDAAFLSQQSGTLPASTPVPEPGLSLLLLTPLLYRRRRARSISA